jgi:2-methylcitrate dehydratase PrpD
LNAIRFVHDLAFDDLPRAVAEQAKRCVLDLLGVAAAGIQTDLSRIARNFVFSQMGAGGRGARMLFDGRPASPAGAAFAGASTIDAFDAHDGHSLTKGHAGAALLPALLALSDSERIADGRGFLTSLAVGYEIAIRAGIALHASAAEYHTSGAWNAIGCAAMVARALGLDVARTRHALGIAEYNGPRSQMMRCIDHPTMIKDGSGWGAMAGVSAGYLAAEGFTGAPAVTVERVQHGELWADLGAHWRILELYFKPYPVCRWAQPAMEAADSLVRRHAIEAGDIVSIEVETFDHAVRLGARTPTTTEEAQYAIAFPLAALLARGRLGAQEIAAGGFGDARTQALAARVSLRENPDFTRRFPAERLAKVVIRRRDGSFVGSEPTPARGEADAPLDDEAMMAKFRDLASGFAARRRTTIEDAVGRLDNEEEALARLLDAVLAPTDPAQSEPDRGRRRAKSSASAFASARAR